jgi:hypothetical protein
MLQSSVKVIAAVAGRPRSRVSGGKTGSMIDLFSLGIAHALMMLAAWRLMRRPDLDRDDDQGGQGGARAPWGRRPEARPGDA